MEKRDKAFGEAGKGRQSADDELKLIREKNQINGIKRGKE